MKRIIKNGLITLVAGLAIAGIYSQTGDTSDENWYTARAIVQLMYGRHCFAAYHNMGGKYDGLGQYTNH